MASIDHPGTAAGEPRSAGALIVAVLALLQGIAGLVWASESLRAGGETMGRGVLFVPLMGAALFGRGGFAITVALLYAVFAGAIFAGRSWAWPVGIVATVLNLLGVLVLALAGEPPATALFRGGVAVVILGYLAINRR
jgi:hypothetical protein